VPSSYQVMVVNAIFSFENALDAKESADAVAGDLANVLFENQIAESTALLTIDNNLVQEAATAGNSGNWTTSDSNNFSLANSNYQNDSSISQTGQNNASTAVQQLQSQVSQDGTNISNAISIANVLVQIGQYMGSILSKAYTA